MRDTARKPNKRTSPNHQHGVVPAIDDGLEQPEHENVKAYKELCQDITRFALLEQSVNVEKMCNTLSNNGGMEMPVITSEKFNNAFDALLAWYREDPEGFEASMDERNWRSKFDSVFGVDISKGVLSYALFYDESRGILDPDVLKNYAWPKSIDEKNNPSPNSIHNMGSAYCSSFLFEYGNQSTKRWFFNYFPSENQVQLVVEARDDEDKIIRHIENKDANKFFETLNAELEQSGVHSSAKVMQIKKNQNDGFYALYLNPESASLKNTEFMKVLKNPSNKQQSNVLREFQLHFGKSIATVVNASYEDLGDPVFDFTATAEMVTSDGSMHPSVWVLNAGNLSHFTSKVCYPNESGEESGQSKKGSTVTWKEGKHLFGDWVEYKSDSGETYKARLVCAMKVPLKGWDGETDPNDIYGLPDGSLKHEFNPRSSIKPTPKRAVTAGVPVIMPITVPTGPYETKRMPNGKLSKKRRTETVLYSPRIGMTSIPGLASISDTGTMAYQRIFEIHLHPDSDVPPTGNVKSPSEIAFPAEFKKKLQDKFNENRRNKRALLGILRQTKDTLAIKEAVARDYTFDELSGNEDDHFSKTEHTEKYESCDYFDSNRYDCYFTINEGAKAEDPEDQAYTLFNNAKNLFAVKGNVELSRETKSKLLPLKDPERLKRGGAIEFKELNKMPTNGFEGQVERYLKRGNKSEKLGWLLLVLAKPVEQSHLDEWENYLDRMRKEYPETELICFYYDDYPTYVKGIKNSANPAGYDVD